MRNTTHIKYLYFIGAFLVIICLCPSCTQEAQNSSSSNPESPTLSLEQQRIRATKVKFMTSTLQLNPNEAIGFKEVYEKYLDLKFSANERYALDPAAIDLAELSEEQFFATFQKSKNLQVEIAQIERDIIDDFVKVMPAKKVAKFFQIEKKRRENNSTKRQSTEKKSPNASNFTAKDKNIKERFQKQIKSKRGGAKKGN